MIFSSPARWIRASSLLLNLSLTLGALGAESRIDTLIGTGRSELGPIASASQTNIGNPFGVEADAAGRLYVCEVTHHRVWRFDPTTQQLSIVAGTGRRGYSGDGGPATAAELNEPYEVRLDSDGHLYFVEMQNHIVRRVDAKTGMITTIAGTGQAGFAGDGGPARQAQFSQPHSLALDDRAGLYIADIGNHRIRRIDLRTGTIETFAGNDERRLPQAGQPVAGTPVLGPRALYFREGRLWVALREGHSVWRIDLNQPSWQPIAGTGQRGYSGDGGSARQATFDGPKGIVVDSAGNAYVVDTENQAIRRIDAASGLISTVAGRGPQFRGAAGDGGPATSAELNRPHGICLDRRGHIIIGDSENHRVRQVSMGP